MLYPKEKMALTVRLFHRLFERMATTRSAVFRRPYTVCIEGNIGSGKTTFLNHFKQFEDTTVLQEPVELWRDVAGTNLFELMYSDPTRYSFVFQSYVQLTMLQRHTKKTPLPYKIMERSVYSARCFIENMRRNEVLSDVEIVVLESWYDWCIRNTDIRTDLIIYLRTTPEVVYRRMRARARKEEDCVSLEYLKQIHRVHEEWLYHGSLFALPAPVLILDGDKSMDEMLAEVRKCKDSIFESREYPKHTADALESATHASPTKLEVCGST